MVLFCPTCHSIVFPQNGTFYCRVCDMTLDNLNIEKKVVRKEQEKVNVDVDDMQGSVLPKVRIECPKCEHTEAYYYIRQNRAADEAETMYYTCCKCGYKWNV